MEQIRYVKLRRQNLVELKQNNWPHLEPVSVKSHVGVIGVVRVRSTRLKHILLFAIFVFSIISRRRLGVVT